MHYAADRIGQQGRDNSGMGLGTGLAVRDAWVTYKVLGNDLMIQAGRMYIPFTRNYGTTSTKALLTTELDWGQGGIRSGIFYPSKVGRDDSVTLWGNVLAEVVMPDASGAEDTNVYGAGLNYYIKGLANKLTAEYTRVDSDNDEIGETDIITVQAAFGF